MFSDLKNNIKIHTKQITNLHSVITAKSAIYFGLIAYWAVIIFGTFLNI